MTRKRLTTFLLAACLWMGMQAQEIEYTQSDSALVVSLLDMAKNQRGQENPIFYFGKKFLGIPYVAHTLELGDKEHLIVNLHGLDCTTFVETVVALAMCDQQDFQQFLQESHENTFPRGDDDRLHLAAPLLHLVGRRQRAAGHCERHQF